jgi:hypothetical protein
MFEVWFNDSLLIFHKIIYLLEGKNVWFTHLEVVPDVERRWGLQLQDAMVLVITSVAYAFAMAEWRLNQLCISTAPWPLASRSDELPCRGLSSFSFSP